MFRFHKHAPWLKIHIPRLNIHRPRRFNLPLQKPRSAMVQNLTLPSCPMLEGTLQRGQLTIRFAKLLRNSSENCCTERSSSLDSFLMRIRLSRCC
mmetsp:Transcript_2106/g.3188  ORF Transcript_2106/g.3188 Transcript_2106/m.3188 type:complete len:95 (+) Transcript_2106:44-328(+)